MQHSLLKMIFIITVISTSLSGMQQKLPIPTQTLICALPVTNNGQRGICTFKAKAEEIMTHHKKQHINPFIFKCPLLNCNKKITTKCCELPTEILFYHIDSQLACHQTKVIKHNEQQHPFPSPATISPHKKRKISPADSDEEVARWHTVIQRSSQQ